MGYVLGAIVNAKGAAYMLALTAASLSAAHAGVPGASAQMPLWSSIGAGSLIGSVLLLGNMRSVRGVSHDETR